MRTGALDVTGQSQWTSIQHDQGEELSEIPTSVCSRECTAGEFKIQKELKCCWECRRCRNNEITILNFTTCDECPQFTWPDQKLFTSCEPIQPYFMKWTEPLAITFSVGSVLGIIMCFGVITCFAVFRNKKIIMASCPTLTFIMLFGNLIAYATIFVLIAKPTNIGCGINRFAFHFSFALNYAPLLAKSSRIYRIFDSGRRGHQRPKFISTRDQVILSTVLITVEVAISLTTLIISPPSAMLNMPVSTEKFVELLCDMPIDSLVAPMAFNILLTIVCLVYGFKTRKLPDNFNESWYIFLSVCSTLFLWLVFVPSYFTAFHAFHKTVVLAAALFLSSTAMVLCLYSPKIYALFYVNEEDLTFQTKRNQKAGAWTTQVHPSGSANPAAGTVEGGQGSTIVLEENGPKTTTS
ncbi:metabotropic glutamate receptor-like [Tubulanus polymorphus]|uniref:metabotropic glutamate receptor-like n=1 Tax=Tubulanus polymorphus TaxID=672921 RepID=UPI003DA53CDF